MLGVVIAAFGIAHVNSAIDAQAVHMVFIQPHCNIVKDELPNFWSAEIRSSAPRRIAALVIIKINPAAVVLAPTVKLPEIGVAVKMIVNDV